MSQPEIAAPPEGKQQTVMRLEPLKGSRIPPKILQTSPFVSCIFQAKPQAIS